MPPSSIQRHHPLVCAVHWLMAGLVLLALLMSTFVMTHLSDADPAKMQGLIRHMLTGSVIALLIAWRLLRRQRYPRPPKLHSGLAWVDRIVPLAHRSLDLLVLLIVCSGMGAALLGGVPQALQAQVPLVPPELMQHPLMLVHRWSARLLAALIVLHVFGALYHHLILRDRLLRRMLPRRG